MGTWLILALGGALLTAAPALAAAAQGSVLTGPIEQLPQSWGDAPLSTPAPAVPTVMAANPAPIPNGEPPAPAPAAPLTALDRALAALDVQTQAQAEVETQRQVASQPPPAADQVGSLVVRAGSIRPSEQTVEKCVTGPAWWRVTGQGASLWIMATPDRMPMATEFDETCLRKRLAAARVVIVPAMPQGGATDPSGRGETPLRAATAPLDQRLPPALWAQLSRRIDNNPARAGADRDWARVALIENLPPGIMRLVIPSAGAGGANWTEYTYWRLRPRTTLQVIRQMPNLYAPPIVVAQRLSQAFDLPGRMGNPAADRAAKLAGAANMLVARTANSAAQFSDLTYLSNPAEADQEACLKTVLDELDAGHAGLGVQDRVRAWAQGDVAGGLKHMNPITTCSFGDLSVRFWSSVVAQDMELIDRVLQGGETGVAVLEYDPLFMRGGVFERLKAEGYRIETPEELR